MTKLAALVAPAPVKLDQLSASASYQPPCTLKAARKPAARPASGNPLFLQQAVEQLDHLIDFAFADVQRRHEAQQVRAWRVEQQPDAFQLQRGLDDGRAAFVVEDQGAQQAGTSFTLQAMFGQNSELSAMAFSPAPPENGHRPF